MDKLKFLMIMICISFAVTAGGKQILSNPANAGGDTYVNPIIHADYSDPDPVAAPDGKTFYMTASSFQCTPGLPILKSTDLVNWTLVNHAVKDVPPAEFYNAAPRHGKGVWAPCIRYHGGEYYIYWGDPDFGIYMVKASDPEGQWSEPVLVKAGKGLIDPTPLWDEDGKAYLANAWAASRAGFNSIVTISEMSADGTRVLGSPVIVFDGNDGINHTIEGPKLYRRGEYYYILAPAGGVVEGWQLALRSKNIYGPYEKKIVMAQGSAPFNGPHQGGWVSTAAGEDWFINFQDKAAYGRVLHLNPLRWVDGWPVIGEDADGDGCGQPVVKHRKPAGLQPSEGGVRGSELFQWHANYNDFFGFPAPGAMMRLYGHKLSDNFVNLWEVPNLWLQKFPAEEFTATAKVQVSAKSVSEGVSSGIIVMGWDYCRLGLAKEGGAFVLQMARCTNAEQGSPESVAEIARIEPSRVYSAGLYPNMERDLWLRVKVGRDGMCRFYYSLDGKRYAAAGEPFKARAGKWIGAKIGFYSITPSATADRGWMDIIDFDIK